MYYKDSLSYIRDDCLSIIPRLYGAKLSGSRNFVLHKHSHDSDYFYPDIYWVECNFRTTQQWLNNEHNCDTLCFIEQRMFRVNSCMF